MTAEPNATPIGVPPLKRAEKGAMGLAALAAAGVGALGLASSFDAVTGAAVRWDFGHPWMLPVGIDVAIPVFTAANLLLIRLGMPLAWVRFVPWVLTLVTCWLNVAAGREVAAKVAHGTMPLLWVVFSEIAAHMYAVRIGAATGRRMEKIRKSRWLHAPFSTYALWRRMALWEVTSYSTALELEKRRLLDRAAMREQYGKDWRKTAPERERVLLRLGQFTQADPAAGTVQPQPAPVPASAPVPQERTKPARKTTGTTGKGRTKAAQRTTADLLAEARTVTTDWADTDVNAEALRKALRCGSGPARQVRDALLAERADGRALHPVTDPSDDDQEVAA
ncbi:DUF2637 domain-containing protein [Streptomyces sp. NPDC096324]|uniref:DUF2637 domain-containing protein n=1 Tax=Streptomyces sp. NPDC096324 TaxID=3366085 RepID=UPI003829234A